MFMVISMEMTHTSYFGLISDTSGDDAEGLRERKKRATRRALRVAGLTLVAKHGLEGVTTEEIAAAAGVSQRTLFNYFVSKEDVLVGSDPSAGDAIFTELAKRPLHEPPLVALREVFVKIAATALEDEGLWHLRMRVVKDNPTLTPALFGASTSFMKQLIKAVSTRVGVDPDLDPYPRLLAHVAFGAARATLHHYFSQDSRQPMSKLMEEAFNSLDAGLPPPRFGDDYSGTNENSR